MSDVVTDMRITSRAFQRNFAQMKANASAGEKVTIVSGSQEYLFQAIPRKTWQGALKGKGKVKGDLFSTGLPWEASR